MVDSLRASIQQLDPPDCPHCRIKMRWYRAELRLFEPPVIEHYFICPNCRAVLQVQTPFEGDADPGPPPKLSRTRRAVARQQQSAHIAARLGRRSQAAMKR